MKACREMFVDVTLECTYGPLSHLRDIWAIMVSVEVTFVTPDSWLLHWGLQGNSCWLLLAPYCIGGYGCNFWGYSRSHAPGYNAHKHTWTRCSHWFVRETYPYDFSYTITPTSKIFLSNSPKIYFDPINMSR